MPLRRKSHSPMPAMQQNTAETSVFFLPSSCILAVIAGICRPRCRPISTNDQCDIDKCILLAKETGAIP